MWKWARDREIAVNNCAYQFCVITFYILVRYTAQVNRQVFYNIVIIASFSHPYQFVSRVLFSPRKNCLWLLDMFMQVDGAHAGETERVVIHQYRMYTSTLNERTNWETKNKNQFDFCCYVCSGLLLHFFFFFAIVRYLVVLRFFLSSTKSQLHLQNCRMQKSDSSKLQMLNTWWYVYR